MKCVPQWDQTNLSCNHSTTSLHNCPSCRCTNASFLYPPLHLESHATPDPPPSSPHMRLMPAFPQLLCNRPETAFTSARTTLCLELTEAANFSDRTLCRLAVGATTLKPNRRLETTSPLLISVLVKRSTRAVMLNLVPSSSNSSIFLF